MSLIYSIETYKYGIMNTKQTKDQLIADRKTLNSIMIIFLKIKLYFRLWKKIQSNKQTAIYFKDQKLVSENSWREEDKGESVRASQGVHKGQYAS